MKKYLHIILIIFVLIQSASVCAKSGDEAGNFYSTDIKTYLNGAEIDSINIGGQTLINAEDMQYYGFGVVWLENERRLEIYENPDSVSNTETDKIFMSNSIKYPLGTPVGKYYETDIKTFLDNLPIESYNTGGRTYIHAEEMLGFGYDVVWNPQKRTLVITSPKCGGYCYTVALSSASVKDENYPEACGNAYVEYTKNGIKGKGEADYFDMTMNYNGKEYIFDMEFYQNKALFRASDFINKINRMCTDNSETDLSDLANQNIGIEINGHRSQKVGVIPICGNGHYGFCFKADDLPKFKFDEIYEIKFTVGNPVGDYYEINIPSA